MGGTRRTALAPRSARRFRLGRAVKPSWASIAPKTGHPYTCATSVSPNHTVVHSAVGTLLLKGIRVKVRGSLRANPIIDALMWMLVRRLPQEGKQWMIVF